MLLLLQDKHLFFLVCVYVCFSTGIHRRYVLRLRVLGDKKIN